MLLVIACLFATAAAGPITYDRRQEGDFNAQVDVSNLLFVFAIPKKIPTNLFDLFSKNAKPVDRDHDIQERANIRVMEAFVEPSTPYHVEIGSDGRSVDTDVGAADVVIAGRRRLETETMSDAQDDELKLLGATENCGPGRVRDSVTLMCKDIEPVEPVEAVEPVEPVEAVQPVVVSTEADKPNEQKENKIEEQPTPEVIPAVPS